MDTDAWLHTTSIFCTHAALLYALGRFLLVHTRMFTWFGSCREQMTYKVSAIAASVGVTALAIAAVYYRFSWHMRDGAEFPTIEAIATLLLTVGGVVRTAF